MSSRFRLNLCARQDQILRLGLDSEYAQSFLLRTEERLRDSKYQRALRLLDETDAERYESVLDWILGVCVPAWNPHILAYYQGSGLRLGHAADYATIDALDQRLDLVVVQLRDVATSIPMWETECPYVRHEVVRAAVRAFLTFDCPGPTPSPAGYRDQTR